MTNHNCMNREMKHNVKCENISTDFLRSQSTAYNFWSSKLDRNTCWNLDQSPLTGQRVWHAKTCYNLKLVSQYIEWIYSILWGHKFLINWSETSMKFSKKHFKQAHPDQEIPPSIKKAGCEKAYVTFIENSTRKPHECPYCPMEYAHRTKLLKHCKGTFEIFIWSSKQVF